MFTFIAKSINTSWPCAHQWKCRITTTTQLQQPTMSHTITWHAWRTCVFVCAEVGSSRSRLTMASCGRGWLHLWRHRPTLSRMTKQALRSHHQRCSQLSCSRWHLSPRATTNHDPWRSQLTARRLEQKKGLTAYIKCFIITSTTPTIWYTHIDAIMNMPHVLFLVSVCRQTVRDWGLLQKDIVLIEHMKKWATLTCPSP